MHVHHLLPAITATLIWASAIAVTAAAAESPQRLPLASEFVGPDAHVSVLLPEAYTTEPEARFRVLYVLPVEPNDGRRLGDPLAVIPFIEGRFRTLAKPEGRLLLGFSKSGLGAVSLLLRHGDVFGFAASWDAPLMFTDQQFGIWKTDEHFGTPDSMASQMPTTLLRKHAAAFQDRPRLVITGKNKFGTFSDRKFPYDGPSHTEAFHALADELGVPHVYNAEMAANHSWHKKWVGPLVDMLMKLASNPEVETPANPSPGSDSK